MKQDKMEHTEDFAVLVNSCDKFEDCWEPFFRLWDTYGLHSDVRFQHLPIYLNTERKHYSYPNLNLLSTSVCEHWNWNSISAPTWSWCLARALDTIKENFVLYLQEDYFLQEKMDEDWVLSILCFMREHKEIGCIHLAGRSKQASPWPEYWIRPASDLYFVSCQAAIWRKSVLQALLRQHESAWAFERWGSKRAALAKMMFLIARPRHGNQPISYIWTGIIQGKWYKPTVELFRKNNIPEPDWNRRGFYLDPALDPSPRLCRMGKRMAYLVRAIFARYVFPLKSLQEVVRLRCAAFFRKKPPNP